eukprot:TRINITY_DN14338_c0_g1_i1.p1 TRINITY_DN14338_c0_g1~~TRINITY_DN14338_c0_g1_i1.p1  ORF type:complete len:445 (+),score=66.43 TRINITY_DN14338_c0_g1_i1:178-1335(+)
MGLGVGLGGLVIVSLLSVYSIWMMLWSSEVSKQKTYENLVEATLPRAGRIITSIFVLLLIFGALSGFLIIIGDILCGNNGIVPFITPVKAWYTDRDVLVSFVTALFVFPLCMLRNISKLEYSAFAAVIIIIFFTGVIMVLSIQELIQGKITFKTVPWYPTDFNKFFNALPVIALAFTCQMNIFPIWSELHNPTLRRMNIVNISSITLSGALYFLVGLFGFVLYPNTSNEGGNILQSLPSTPFYTAVRAFFVAAILFHYPVVHFTFRGTIEKVIFANYKFNWIRHTIETILVLSATLVWSIEFPSLGDVFSLTGSLAAFPICFIIPALCYIRLVIFKYADTPIDCTLKNFMGNMKKIIFPMLVIVFGTIAMVIGIYTSIVQLIADS